MDYSELPETITPETTNLLTVQVRSGEEWLDYASIKDDADLRAAKRLVIEEHHRFRIVGRLPQETT